MSDKNSKSLQLQMDKQSLLSKYFSCECSYLFEIDKNCQKLFNKYSEIFSEESYPPINIQFPNQNQNNENDNGILKYFFNKNKNKPGQQIQFQQNQQNQQKQGQQIQSNQIQQFQHQQQLGLSASPQMQSMKQQQNQQNMLHQRIEFQNKGQQLQQMTQQQKLQQQQNSAQFRLSSSPFRKSKLALNYQEKIWFYQDQNNNIQGPFSTLQMDQWWNDQMLPHKLKIAYKSTQRFSTLDSFFKNVHEGKFKARNDNLTDDKTQPPGLLEFLSGPIERNVQQKQIEIPVPIDDGLSDHLINFEITQNISLASTLESCHFINISMMSKEEKSLIILFLMPYINTSQSDFPMESDKWFSIPGAFGCLEELKNIEENLDKIKSLINQDFFLPHFFVVTVQEPEVLQEMKKQMNLKIDFLSDEIDQNFNDQIQSLQEALNLPLINNKYLKRMTLIIYKSRIKKCFYPIFPVNKHAQQLTIWLEQFQKEEIESIKQEQLRLEEERKRLLEIQKEQERILEEQRLLQQKKEEEEMQRLYEEAEKLRKQQEEQRQKQEDEEKERQKDQLEQKKQQLLFVKEQYRYKIKQNKQQNHQDDDYKRQPQHYYYTVQQPQIDAQQMNKNYDNQQQHSQKYLIEYSVKQSLQKQNEQNETQPLVNEENYIKTFNQEQNDKESNELQMEDDQFQIVKKGFNPKQKQKKGKHNRQQRIQIAPQIESKDASIREEQKNIEDQLFKQMQISSEKDKNQIKDVLGDDFQPSKPQQHKSRNQKRQDYREEEVQKKEIQKQYLMSDGFQAVNSKKTKGNQDQQLQKQEEEKLKQQIDSEQKSIKYQQQKKINFTLENLQPIHEQTQMTQTQKQAQQEITEKFNKMTTTVQHDFENPKHDQDPTDFPSLGEAIKVKKKEIKEKNRKMEQVKSRQQQVKEQNPSWFAKDKYGKEIINKQAAEDLEDWEKDFSK